MHTLPIAYARVHLTPNEQYVQHHVLGSGLPEVDVFRHASLNILEDFGAEGFVGSKSYPRGLSRLSTWYVQIGSANGDMYVPRHVRSMGPLRIQIRRDVV